MTITKKIKMDLFHADPKTVDAVQGDNCSRCLEFSLYTADKPFSIPENTSVIIRYKKPDKTGGEYDTLPDGTPAWKVSRNAVTITLAPQVLTCHGTVELSVTLVCGGTHLTTFPLSLRVRPTVNAQAADSQNYFYVTSILTAPTEAQVGDCLRVSAVNNQGSVTALEAVPAETFAATHSWDGSVLTVTSVSGTSSADLKGEPGDTGPVGPDGKSAYELAVEAGYLGTREEFSKKLAVDYIDWFGKGISIPSGSDLNDYKTSGKYYVGAEATAKTLINCPTATNFVMFVFVRTSGIYSQLIITLHGKMYIRSANSSGYRAWVAYTTSDEIEELTAAVKQELLAAMGQQCQAGLKVAIIGDSISTHPDKNVSEVVIEADDVGAELASYITLYDVDKTISLDGTTSGYTITAEDVGRQLTFMPCAEDVGKTLGTPKNYNSITDVWWQVAADALGFEPIPACWSGSSITAHTAATSGKEASCAWHDSTIRKLGKRIPGSMQRTAPDVVLIYRGTNDLSHSEKVRLTDGYFDTENWMYPTTDRLSAAPTYGFKEGLALTIRKIRQTYPRARIVLCTCNTFKRSNYSHFPTNNGVFSLPQMNDAIREVAAFFGCPVIDLDKCGITFENCYDEGYITDSATTPTHPNAAGHALLAQQAISDLVNKVHIYDIVPSDAVADPIGIDTANQTEIGDLYGSLAEGCYIESGTGVFNDAGTSETYFAYTDIEVLPGTTYSAPYARNTAFYDADGTYLSLQSPGGTADSIITTPLGCGFMTVTYKYTNYEDPAAVTIRKANGAAVIGGVKGILREGTYVVDTSGNFKTSSNYFCYADIPVDEGAAYSTPYARNTAFFDTNGSYISGLNSGGAADAVVSAPEGAVKMAVTFKYADLDTTAVCIRKTKCAGGSLTAAQKEEIVQEVISALGTPVFGTVSEDNIITLSGTLTEGTYTLKYENADGSLTDIGDITVSNSGDSGDDGGEDDGEEGTAVAIQWSDRTKLDKTAGTVSTADYYAASQLITYDSGSTYTLHVGDNSLMSSAACWYDASGSYLGYNDTTGVGDGGATSGVLTPLSNAASFRIRLYINALPTDSNYADLLGSVSLTKTTA